MIYVKIIQLSILCKPLLIVGGNTCSYFKEKRI